MSGPRPGLARAGSSIAAARKTIVLVTGGNTGIGYEIVKSLAHSRPDYQILLGCRDTNKGEAAAASMGAPINVNPIQLDISDDTSIAHCHGTIEQMFARLDILINNAGTLGLDLTRGGREPTPRETWSHIFNTNVVSTGVFTERMIPLLERSSRPKIIFISSTLGSIGAAFKVGKPLAPELPHYSASKTAVNMLAVHYALDHPHFKVNAVCPGLRATGLNDLGASNAEDGTELSEDLDPALGAVNAVRLATEGPDGATATYTNTEGELPW